MRLIIRTGGSICNYFVSHINDLYKIVMCLLVGRVVKHDPSSRGFSGEGVSGCPLSREFDPRE